MTEKLKQFINENLDLINSNSKESWEKIYEKLDYAIKGEFTQTILNADINDPAEILSYLPEYYLSHSEIQEYAVPNSVTSIGKCAFFACYSLTSVLISDSVTSIGREAFRNCTSLTSVKIGDSVTSIGGFAFDFCNILTSIVIPDSVTDIGECAFSCCHSLTSATIGDSVTNIGEWSFSGCKSLKSVQMGMSVMSIGESAFRGCSSLKRIHYKGTKKQAIQLGLKKEEWRKNSAIKKIICTDGELIL